MEEVLIPFATQSGVVIMAFIDISAQCTVHSEEHIWTFSHETLCLKNFYLLCRGRIVNTVRSAYN